MVFQTAAPPVAAVYEKVFTAASAIGSKAAAVPLHTCKTQYGLAAVYDLGVEDDSLGPEWKWKRKAKHSKSVEFQLLPQMRGRHIFGAGSKAKGRCFEWRVIRDKARCGAPKFIISEFLLNKETGFREHATKVTASNPNQLWNLLFTEVLGLAAPGAGAHLCGFDDQSLAYMLKVHFQGGLPSYETFHKFDELSDRYKRHISNKVSDMFWETMRRACSQDPMAAFHALRESARFKADAAFADDECDSLLHDPFVIGMVDAHEHAPENSKLGILSLFAPYFSVAVTCKLFNVNPRRVTKAKVHDANAMAGQPFAKEFVQRMKLSPRTFAFMHQWCRSSFAVSASDASTHNRIRLEIRTRLYKRYKAHAESELRVKAVSKDCFMRHMRDGFVDETVESCCCQGCIDGWTALQMLRDFVTAPQYMFPDRTHLSKKIDEIEEFLKGDYRWKHLSETSHEAMHCMQHALGCNVNHLSHSCDHDHVNTCVECNMLPMLVQQLELHTHNMANAKVEAAEASIAGHKLPQSDYWSNWTDWHVRNDPKIHGIPVGHVWTGAGSVEAKTLMDTVSMVEGAHPAPGAIDEARALEEEMEAHLKMLRDEVQRYQAHLVRKHKASQGQMHLLSEVTAKKALIFIDYKQKVLPCENKEAQSRTFGKKGKSLFGMVTMLKIPEGYSGKLPEGTDIEGDFAISYFRGCCDDANQDFAHSVQCFQVGLKFLKKQYPWIEEAMLYSDGAGNFRSLSFQLAMADMAAAVGVKITAHLLPEAGDGKDRVDRDFAGINTLFWSWLKRPGASMQNAVEMVEALEYGKNKGDGVVNCALQISRPAEMEGVDTAKFSRLVGKARDNMYYSEFTYAEKDGVLIVSGARFYAYYKMGTGVYLSAKQLQQLWLKRVPVGQARILAGSNLGDIGALGGDEIKMELGKERKKCKAASKLEAKQQKQRQEEEEAHAAQIELDLRKHGRRCPTCDKVYLNQKRSWVLHSQVCKEKGRAMDKSAQESAALGDNQFNSMAGTAVTVVSDADFPVPQNSGYAMLQEIPAFKISWKRKFLLLGTALYSSACSVVKEKGWATKEKCRRPAIHHPTDVVQELSWCFDAVPRLNNYEIHKHLKKKFEIGFKVLRVSQISGWITGELKRRKDAALKAASIAATFVEQAMTTDGAIDSSKLDEQQEKIGDIFEACKDEFDIESAALFGLNLEMNPEHWKKRWRCDLFPARREQREKVEEDQLEKARAKQQRAEKKRQREEAAEVKKRQREEAAEVKKRQMEEAAEVKDATESQGDEPAPKKRLQGKRKKAAEGSMPKEKQQNPKETAKVAEETMALLPGQAWSNCCGSAVAEGELDGNGNCKDQSDASECKKREQKRGKRRRCAPRQLP
jgi:hypothetical protein